MVQQPLPVELTTHIVKYVSSDCAFEDLTSCSLVSRAWHGGTFPILFRKVAFTYDDGEQEAHSISAASIQVNCGNLTTGGAAQYHGVVPARERRLSTFLAFLNSCPSHAAAVRELSLTAHQPSEDPGHLTDPWLFMRVMQRLPRLDTVRLVDVLLTYPIHLVPQTCDHEEVHYHFVSVLHHATTIFMDHVDDVVTTTHVSWLLGLFSRIGELHMYGDTLVPENEEDLTQGNTTEVETVIWHDNGLFDGCHVLRIIKPESIRVLDLGGPIRTSDIPTLGYLLSSASNLEKLVWNSSSVWKPLVQSWNAPPPQPDKLLQLPIVASQKLRTLTIRSICVQIMYSTQTVLEILRHLPPHLKAQAPAENALPLDIHLVFDQSWWPPTSARPPPMPNDPRTIFSNLERVLNNLTDSRRANIVPATGLTLPHGNILTELSSEKDTIAT
ncbi:hypothetical protein NM688_g4039 [Phlebia brevispora]|uniref:Uncharacterized protein n=1 Tax=Phlebia brevispora TaxID=194682 RepID=A0ACC1T4P5_9APHY|nr:hypothetical protein NM688_g4039 [Phlebia brevispora]